MIPRCEMNRRSTAFSKSAKSFNARALAFVSRWLSSQTASKRLTACLRRSASKASWKARRLAPLASSCSIGTSFANISWASLGRLRGRFQAANWPLWSANAKARTHAIAGLWRMLRGGSDARSGRCERPRSCEGNGTRVGRRFGKACPAEIFLGKRFDNHYVRLTELQTRESIADVALFGADSNGVPPPRWSWAVHACRAIESLPW